MNTFFSLHPDNHYLLNILTFFDLSDFDLWQNFFKIHRGYHLTDINEYSFYLSYANQVSLPINYLHHNTPFSFLFPHFSNTHHTYEHIFVALNLNSMYTVLKIRHLYYLCLVRLFWWLVDWFPVWSLFLVSSSLFTHVSRYILQLKLPFHSLFICIMVSKSIKVLCSLTPVLGSAISTSFSNFPVLLS